MKTYWCVALSALSVACGQSADVAAGPVCADIGVPAISLLAVSSLTRQPIVPRALVIARDGAYADTAVAVGTPPLYAMAYNRPGTYAISVELSGYDSWRLDDVVVRRGQCNVTTVPLAASLIPSTSAAELLNER